MAERIDALHPTREPSRWISAGLRLAMSPDSTVGRGRAMAQLAESSGPWDVLLERLGQEHLLVPMLPWLLRHGAAQLDAQRCETLETLRREAVAASLTASTRIHRSLAALESVGIDALTLKGPVLGQQIYGDPARRLSADIDILVGGDRQGDAARILCSGKLEAVPIGRPWMRGLAPRRGSVHLRGPAGANVDLHHTLSSPSLRFEPAKAVLWGTTRELPLGPRQVRTLGPEVGVLYLAVHGAKHDWESGSHIADLAGALAADEGLSWTLLRRLSRATGARRILRTGILMAMECAPAAVPPEAAAWLRRDRVALALSRAILMERLGAAASRPGRATLLRRRVLQQEQGGGRVRAVLGKLLGLIGG